MQWLFDIILEMVADAGYALKTWVQDRGYATEAWVEAKDYTTLAEVLTEIQGTRLLVRRSFIQSIPSGVRTRVLFADEIFDTLSEWEALPDWHAEIDNAGYYQCSWSVGFRPTLGVNKVFQTRLLVNNVNVALDSVHSSHNAYITTGGSILIHLNANDVVHCDCYHNSGFNVNLDYTNNMTYLSIERIP